jgi:hypothetical protein
MLDFTAPANGWDVIYAAVATGLSVVVAFFLGMLAERARDRWVRYDAWSHQIRGISRAIWEAAQSEIDVEESVEQTLYELSWSNKWLLSRKDWYLAESIVGRLQRLSNRLTKEKDVTAVRDAAGEPRPLPGSQGDDWGPIQVDAISVPDLVARYRKGSLKRREVVREFLDEEKEYWAEQGIADYPDPRKNLD